MTKTTHINNKIKSSDRRLNNMLDHNTMCDICGCKFVGFINQTTCNDCTSDSIKHAELLNVVYVKKVMRYYKDQY